MVVILDLLILLNAVLVQSIYPVLITLTALGPLAHDVSIWVAVFDTTKRLLARPHISRSIGATASWTAG